MQRPLRKLAADVGGSAELGVLLRVETEQLYAGAVHMYKVKDSIRKSRKT